VKLQLRVNCTSSIVNCTSSNGSFKKMERAAFRDYFTNTITKELESDPEKDVTTIKVDLKLSTLKPIHLKLMNGIYNRRVVRQF